MRLAVVREGRALLAIPDPEAGRSPHGFEPAWLPVFYNPRMIFNRDLSVVVLGFYASRLAPHRPVVGVDALSGTGVRAIRYALELEPDGIGVMHANDIDPRACSLIEYNARLNGLPDRVRAHCMDARSLLYDLYHKEPLLFIDIDPFGSPAPFASAALRAVGHGGLAAFTATDLAVLEGGKANAARRKYWVNIERVPEHREIGLRVLIGYLARAAAAHDKAVKPLLAYYADHYYRVYLLVERGARKADKMLETMVGDAYYCPQLKRTTLGEPPCKHPRVLGPLWKGPLLDEDAIKSITELASSSYTYIQTRTRVERLLEILVSEASTCGQCIYYRLPALASALRVNVPRVLDVVEQLRAQGYRASRTHLDPAGIRTDAPYDVIAELVRSGA